jgi:hypothetical protein
MEGYQSNQSRSRPAEIRALIAELDTTLSAEYPPEQRHGLALDAIFQPHLRFFLARLDGGTVGCGGVALFADFAEVKRMYVRRAARRGGGGSPRCCLRASRRRRWWQDCRCCGSSWQPPGRGDAALSAGRVSSLPGLRGLCRDACEFNRDKRVLREAAGPARVDVTP